MTPVELLSNIVIDTLREFSARKDKLTADSLKNALLSRKELIPILARVEHPGNHGEDRHSDAPLHTVPARVPLCKKTAGGESGPADFLRTRATYEKILDELAPISKGEYAESFADLRQRVNECKTMEGLAECSEEIVGMERLLVSRVAGDILFANDFLADLSKDLVGMEQQLFSYQSQNRETFLLNDSFCSNMLSHTEEMNQVIDGEFEGKGSLIASKLAAIGKAINLKRQVDQVRLKEADTKIAELQMSVRSYNDEITQVTERANALEREVLIDALTEINNRRSYEIEVNACMRRFLRDGQPFSLILMDVDLFKNVNDQFGHRAGDKCLYEIAKRLKAALRKADFLARYGGEELVAILQGSNAEDSVRVAEKLRRRIEQTRFCFGDAEIPVTISVGVTEVRPTDDQPETTFIRVDQAMYKAKKEGRNRVCMM